MRKCECEGEYGEAEAVTGMVRCERYVRGVRTVLLVSVLNADASGAESMRRYGWSGQSRSGDSGE